MSNQKRIAEVNTATQILKGALLKTLNVKQLPTISVNCLKKNEGRVTVQGQKFSDEQLSRMEKLTNEKIKQNVLVRTFVLERSEAESKYGKDLIYDKIPPPDNVKELFVVAIDDWNVNSCLGDHVKSTGDVRPIRILRQNVRENKNEVEIVFEFVQTDFPQPEQTAASNLSSRTTTRKSFDGDDVVLLSEALLSEIITELQKLEVDVGSKEFNLRTALKPRLEARLNTLKNASYSRGYATARTHNEDSRMM